MTSVVSIDLFLLFLDGIIRVRDLVLVGIDSYMRNFFFIAVLRTIWVFIDGGSFSWRKGIWSCSLIFEEWWCGIAVENRCQLRNRWISLGIVWKDFITIEGPLEYLIFIRVTNAKPPIFYQTEAPSRLISISTSTSIFVVDCCWE